MSSALAVEGRFTVAAFLKQWVHTGLLSYKFSVHENALEPQRVRATFSKPTAQTPAAAAVAHLYFHLDPSLHRVLGFTVESETHFHSVETLRFDEAILDHAIRRKLVLKQQQLVGLGDEFASTRVPALRQQRLNETRDRDRDALEGYLLEHFQRKDPYNDGRLSFHECRDVLFALELPTVGRRDREILFAFVELDRDDMVDYSALVAIGAEVLDTLLHTEPPLGKGDDNTLEHFQTLVRHRQFFAMDRLAQVLESFRPATLAPLATEETLDEPGEPLGDTGTVLEEESEAETSEAMSEPTSRAPTPAPFTELAVTRRQLRTSLESPPLLLSRAEINMVTALATTNGAGQIPCQQLNELLQHVQTLVFRFQTRCFTDRILASYLLQQFTNYESSHLQGAAEHLQKRIRQKEVKSVVKDMKKLLLTPYQISRLVALCEASPANPDHVAHYVACIPRLVDWLHTQVDPLELRERATAAHRLHQTPSEPLPDEETLRHAAVEAFETLDGTRTGVLSIGDFHASLRQLSRAIESSVLDDADAVAAITVLADPLGHGRVNYIFFQQLVFPALRWLQYEQRVATSRRDASQVQRAEAKATDDQDDEAEK